MAGRFSISDRSEKLSSAKHATKAESRSGPHRKVNVMSKDISKKKSEVARYLFRLNFFPSLIGLHMSTRRAFVNKELFFYIL